MIFLDAVTNWSNGLGRLNRTDHASINKSLKLIESGFNKSIKLADLAKVSGMSPRGFLKAFKRHMGICPGKYLRNIRIGHAKHLLVERDIPLKAVALSCGFRSENTLCVAFLREVKISPKRFQREYWRAAYRDLVQTNNLPLSFDRTSAATLQNALNNGFRYNSRVSEGRSVRNELS